MWPSAESVHVDRLENVLWGVGELRRVEEGRVAAGEGAEAGVGLGEEAAGMNLEVEGMAGAGLGDGVAGVEEAAGDVVEADAAGGADAGAGVVGVEEEADSRLGDAESEAGAAAGDGVVGSRAWGERWTSSLGRRLVRASAATCRTGGMLSSCWSVWARGLLRGAANKLQVYIYIYARWVCGRVAAAMLCAVRGMEDVRSKDWIREEELELAGGRGRDERMDGWLDGEGI